MKKKDWRFFEVNGRNYRVYDSELKSFERLKEMLLELNTYTHHNWDLEWFIECGMFTVKIYDENYSQIHVSFEKTLDKAMYSATDFLCGGLKVARILASPLRKLLNYSE